MKVTVHVEGIAETTTWLRDASMVKKKLSELQRSGQVRPQKRVAAIMTGSEGPVGTYSWLNPTTVEISCEEEPTEWTAIDCDNICDNITGKRFSPEDAQIARREELDFMDKLAVLQEVPLDQCWLDTNAKPMKTK